MNLSSKKGTLPLGRTALHWAAYNGHHKMAIALVLRGADPNIKDKNGKTPYDLAVATSHEKIAALLRGRTHQPPVVKVEAQKKQRK